MSELRRQINTTLAQLSKAMSRSEAASVAGKASAAARKAKAGGGAPEQTTDFNAASAKANRLIAANPGKYGPKGAKGKGKAKAGAKAAKDPVAAKAKAEKDAQAKAEHEQRQKEHAEDRAQRQQDREQRQKEHAQAQAEHAQDRAQRQADREQRQKQQADKEKPKASGGGKKSGSGDAKKQEKADKQKAQAELTSAASALASGGQVTEQQMQRLVTEGLAQPRKFGGIELTPAGKSAAKRGAAQKMAKAQIDSILAANGLSMHDPALLIKHVASVSGLHGWAAITKVDEEKRIVYGIASSELPDNEPGIWKGEAYQGDIISSDAMRAAAPDYLQFPAIREMHQPSAAGTAVHFEVNGAETLIGALIVDDQAWAKVVGKVYRGFSIGGRCKDAEIIKIDGRPFRKVTKLDLTEISLVDRPRNPDAKITLFKGVDMEPEQDATEVAETTIAKAADPTKAIALLQQLRNDAETSGDMDAADEYTAAIRSVAQAAGIATTVADDEDADPSDDGADDSALAMDDGSDPADDVAMAQSIGDLRKAHPELSDEGLIGLLLKQMTAAPIAKRGMALSSANLAHAKTAHDALHKMTGGAVCAPDGQPQRQMAGIAMAATLAPDDLAKALTPAFDGIAKVLEQNGLVVAGLAKRLEHLERQPAPGGPAVRAVAVEKVLPGGDIAKAASDPAATELELLKRQRDEATDPAILKYLGDEIAKRMIAQGYRALS